MHVFAPCWVDAFGVLGVGLGSTQFPTPSAHNWSNVSRRIWVPFQISWNSESVFDNHLHTIAVFRAHDSASSIYVCLHSVVMRQTRYSTHTCFIMWDAFGVRYEPHGFHIVLEPNLECIVTICIGSFGIRCDLFGMLAFSNESTPMQCLFVLCICFAKCIFAWHANVGMLPGRPGEHIFVVKNVTCTCKLK